MQEVEDALVRVVEALTGVHGRCSVGVAAAGFVDARGERVRFAPHSARGATSRSRSGSPTLGRSVVGDVYVDNDANCALAAEARSAAAATRSTS